MGYRIRTLLPPPAERHNSPMPLGSLLPSARVRRSYRNDQGGQAIIIVGLSIVVLLAALALGVEWGYGVTQRRVMQNAADGGALAGAKLLATTVVIANGSVQFRVHQEDVYCAAVDVADANRSFRPTNEPAAILVWGSVDKVNWTPFPPPLPPPGPSGCPAPGTLVPAGHGVDPATVFVRAQANLTYSGLFAAATGQSSLTAGGTAVARITGAAIGTTGYTWPMMRHFNVNDFQTTCNPAPCSPFNPNNVTPVTFWSSSPGQQQDIVFGSFKGLIDFSQYSPNSHLSRPPADSVPQLMLDWDHSGVAPAYKPDIAAPFNKCAPPAPSGKWFTGGNEDDQSYDKDCSIPNWTAYSFGGSKGNDTFGSGSIGLDTNWYRNAQPPQEAPDNAFRTNNRSVCATLAADPKLATVLAVAPSCPNTPTNAEKGDWIETAKNSGDLGSNVSDAMIAFIDAHPLYDQFQHTPTGPGRGAPEYGPHQVINVYLWDCAESFDQSALPGAQWSLALPRTGSDCSNIHSGNDTLATLDRVHVLTVVPFTFYRGLVSRQMIQGFWGGEANSDPGICRDNPSAPGCVINPFANSVFLVSDD